MNCSATQLMNCSLQTGEAENMETRTQEGLELQTQTLASGNAILQDLQRAADSLSQRQTLEVFSFLEPTVFLLHR